MDYYHLKYYINTMLFFVEYNDYHSSRYDYDTENTKTTLFPQIDDEYCFNILRKLFKSETREKHLAGFVSKSFENQTGLYRGNYLNINVDSSALKLELFSNFLPHYDFHEHGKLLKFKNEYRRKSSRNKFRAAFDSNYKIEYFFVKNIHVPTYSTKPAPEVDIYNVQLTKLGEAITNEHELLVYNNNPRLSIEYSLKKYLYSYFMNLIDYSTLLSNEQIAEFKNFNQ